MAQAVLHSYTQQHRYQGWAKIQESNAVTTETTVVTTELTHVSEQKETFQCIQQAEVLQHTAHCCSFHQDMIPRTIRHVLETANSYLGLSSTFLSEKSTQAEHFLRYVDVSPPCSVRPRLPGNEGTKPSEDRKHTRLVRKLSPRLLRTHTRLAACGRSGLTSHHGACISAALVLSS